MEPYPTTPSAIVPEESKAGYGRIRWWPACWILGVAGLIVFGLRFLGEMTFQERNMRSLAVGFLAVVLLMVWWIFLSGTRWRLRVGVFVVVLGILGVSVVSFRIRGVSGDLLPILEPRWKRARDSSAIPRGQGTASRVLRADRRDFPQFLGPDRTGKVPGPILATNWAADPPRIIWRQRVGAAWSGFAIVGERAVTQEQHGEEEQVRCYDLLSGRLQWSHSDLSRYQTTIAGEGPRCTPTVVEGRVLTLGANGILNCLELVSGRRLWRRSITEDNQAGVPHWGYSGSPLVLDDRVLVSAGGKSEASVVAYRVSDGGKVWSAGSSSAGYASLMAATLAGVRQVLAFNASRITSHDAETGAVLWEYPWGVGQPHVAVPVVVSTNTVLFSSGYGVGSELLEIGRDADHRLTVRPLWKSRRMKAKMATLVAHDGFLYGLDDGMLACLDLRDGSQRWKEGRYGHGQGLWAGEVYLLSAENGELVLLRPTPEGPGELGRFRVFDSKTWNPPALAGELLLMRNDQEAACLRLPLRAQDFKPAR